MVEGRHLISELVAHIDDLRHFVGAVAMVLHQDFA
jgi:hypothetical protein